MACDIYISRFGIQDVNVLAAQYHEWCERYMQSSECKPQIYQKQALYASNKIDAFHHYSILKQLVPITKPKYGAKYTGIEDSARIPIIDPPKQSRI